jgi:hypothetical protein
MAERDISCTQPVRGPILAPADDAPASESSSPSQEEPRMIARVGKPAPDFEAMAYHEGGFKPVKLSDFAGHWVVVCFYPGDFTFV